ncbi:MAG: ATP-binding protein [Bacteroidota bacterium]
MLELFAKEEITPDDIHKIIENRAEESIDIEFKNGSELDAVSSRGLDKLSVMVTSFANTSGGLLIFGIETKKRRAWGLSCSVSESFNPAMIIHGLHSRIQKHIPGMEVKQVIMDSSKHASVFIFRIPESRMAPHMAFDRRFYKRSNFREVLMEEYEVRQAYHKTNVADIEFFGVINTGGVPILHNGKFIEMNFYPKFLVRNISSAIEHTWKFELFLPSALHDPSFHALQHYFARHDGPYSVFSVSNRSPLFQEELATVIEAKIGVTKENFHVFDREKIVIRIYFTGGIKTHEYPMKETFRYKMAELNFNDFTVPAIASEDKNRQELQA